MRARSFLFFCLVILHVINYVKFFFRFSFCVFFFCSLIIYCSLMSFVMVSPLIFCTAYFISFCLPMQILTDVKCLIEITFRVYFFIYRFGFGFFFSLSFSLLSMFRFAFSYNFFVVVVVMSTKDKED